MAGLSLISLLPFFLQAVENLTTKKLITIKAAPSGAALGKSGVSGHQGRRRSGGPITRTRHVSIITSIFIVTSPFSGDI
jgi:hypothetical protein